LSGPTGSLAGTESSALIAADARILRSGLRCINMQAGRPQVELTGARQATDMAKVSLDNGALTRLIGRVDGCGRPAAHKTPKDCSAPMGLFVFDELLRTNSSRVTITVPERVLRDNPELCRLVSAWTLWG